MYGKITVSVVSFILVVGIAIGIIVTINNLGDDPQIQSSRKSLGIICQNSNYQKLCHETLKSVKGLDSADPKAYINAAVKATMDSVIKALNMTNSLITDHKSNDNGVKSCLINCKDMLEYAMVSLQLSADMVQNNNIQNVHNENPNFRNWLSAVVSYEQACIFGFNYDKEGEKNIKEQLHLDNVVKYAVLTLDIMRDFPHIIEQFGLKLNLKPARQHLLAEDGYPTWLPPTDRKLLAFEKKKEGEFEFANIVQVANDGSASEYKTIQDAINGYVTRPFKHRKYIIIVKGGRYEEHINIPQEFANITIQGEYNKNIIITGHRSNTSGYKTFQTATFTNNAPGFVAINLVIENTAGPQGKQAVAFRNVGDMSAIINCHISGYQDTLYAQSNRQFYRDCFISGTVDFIFGVSATVIQNSTILVQKPLDTQFNTITADGRNELSLNTGIVIQGCKIYPTVDLVDMLPIRKTYLGRPWKNFSTTVIMESFLGHIIHPEGWHIWDGEHFEDTCYYAEYSNYGIGANVGQRVKWKGYHEDFTRSEASNFTVDIFLRNKDTQEKGSFWLGRDTVHNFKSGFMNDSSINFIHPP